MHPTSTPDNDLPGVDDYQVTIPVTQPDGTAGELRFRLPVSNQGMALVLGRHVATHISQVIDHRHTTDGTPLWGVTVDQVTAERADTPSAEELAAELEHWKRIVTALARKMPGMLHVSGAEYEAADTADLAMVPAGDNAMMILTPAFYREIADAMPTPDPIVVAPDLPAHEEPLLLPADPNIELPAGPVDPDVRQIRLSRLGEFHGGTVEILMDGWWLPVENVSTEEAGTTLTLNLRNTPRDGTTEATFYGPTGLVTVRPATTMTGGYVLSSTYRPSVVGQELMHDGAWWTIRRTELHAVDIYSVSLISADHGTATATIDRDANILIRRRRPGAWS